MERDSRIRPAAGLLYVPRMLSTEREHRTSYRRDYAEQHTRRIDHAQPRQPRNSMRPMSRRDTRTLSETAEPLHLRRRRERAADGRRRDTNGREDAGKARDVPRKTAMTTG